MTGTVAVNPLSLFYRIIKNILNGVDNKHQFETKGGPMQAMIVKQKYRLLEGYVRLSEKSLRESIKVEE